jgi:thiol:disulfide interchange protein DsbD
VRAGPKEVVLSFATVPGYYLYREQFRFTAPDATLAEPCCRRAR